MGKKALLIIDVQNDFCPGGSLAVPEGDKVIPVINRLVAQGGYGLVVASQDWHPANHGSFASQHAGKKVFDMGELAGKPQVMWPDHCVQGSKGAAFHAALDMSKTAYVQKKGENPDIDSYSAFADNGRAVITGLAAYLKAEGVTELHVCGLATEYCVKFSALDAVDMLPGVKVVFVEDASRGIDPAAVDAAKAQMQAAGVRLAQSAELVHHPVRKAKPPKMGPK